MKIKWIGIFLGTVVIASCQQILEIEIVHHQELSIPSVSGVVKSGENYFAIGDDSPFLFSLDKNLKVLSKSAIYSQAGLEGERIPKILKPDFEAMEMISENQIMVLGSGSKSPQRDVLLIITLGDSVVVKEYNTTSFYERLRTMPILDQLELNIEAVAYRDGQLYLFNRGRNVVFTFRYDELMHYLEGTGEFPDHTAMHFELPAINGISSGFSGATAFENYILFTSSVENTANAYDDGEVLGSFVGIIPLSEGKLQQEMMTVIVPNLPAPLKVETITIDKVKSNNEATVILASDSDGGKSQVLRCRLVW